MVMSIHPKSYSDKAQLNFIFFSFLDFWWPIFMKEKIELISKIFFSNYSCTIRISNSILWQSQKSWTSLFLTHFFAIRNRKSHLRKRVPLYWTCFLPQQLCAGVLRDFHPWTCFLLGLRDGVLRDFRHSLWKCEGPMC